MLLSVFIVQFFVQIIILAALVPLVPRFSVRGLVLGAALAFGPFRLFLQIVLIRAHSGFGLGSLLVFKFRASQPE
jgi:hypothetical protein